MPTIDDPQVQQALALTPDAGAWERTVDITTIGRRTGRPHRIETWLYRAGTTNYLSGAPGARNWLANLAAEPRFTLHLKHGVQADLPARGRIVTDPDERRAVLSVLVADLGQPTNPARLARPPRLEEWLAGSPLVEIVFDAG